MQYMKRAFVGARIKMTTSISMKRIEEKDFMQIYTQISDFIGIR